MESKSINFISYDGNRWEVENTLIITEQEVKLSVNNEYGLTFRCTPYEMEAFAVGFLNIKISSSLMMMLPACGSAQLETILKFGQIFQSGNQINGSKRQVVLEAKPA